MTTGPKVCPQCGTQYAPEQRFCPTDGATLVSEKQDGLIGQILADRYLIHEQIGEGGMGQVYIAEHVRMQRRCALKVMHREMARDADAVSRFNREAANASRIQHPNVAAIYDFGEAGDGMLYIAMEFVEGLPLSKVVEQHGGLAPRRAANIIRQTADALKVAHHLGIVHRDLKPDNIMLGQELDGADVVKLLDFGIAKSAGMPSQKVTRTGFIVGTPDYMSPEQMSGDAVDGRSDIYSLALVAVFAFTGALPFDNVSSQRALVARLSDAPRTLAELRPDIPWPEALQRAISKGLEPDPDARYQKVEDFAYDLMQAVNGAEGLDLAMTEARTQVMTPVARTNSAAQSAATSVVTPAKPPKGRLVPFALGGAVVVIGGYVAFNAFGPQPPKPQPPGPGTPTTHVTRTDSLPSKDSVVKAVTQGISQGKPKVDAAAIAGAAKAITDDLNQARASAQKEAHVSAYSALQSANKRIATLERTAPDAPQLSNLHAEYQRALAAVDNACQATLAANRVSGEPLPNCKVAP